MYFRKKTSGGRAYLQIVESRRDGAQVRQQVIATLGRIEDLRDSGQLERLLRSGARFAAKAIVVNAVAEGAVTASAARRIGTPPRPAASLALRAAGVALPPTVRQLADA